MSSFLNRAVLLFRKEKSKAQNGVGHAYRETPTQIFKNNRME